MNSQYDLQIIIPAYNAEKYIEKCLNSILSQKTQYTYVITVINDGSTDETSQILSKYLDDEHGIAQQRMQNTIHKLELEGSKSTKTKYVFIRSYLCI